MNAYNMKKTQLKMGPVPRDWEVMSHSSQGYGPRVLSARGQGRGPVSLSPTRDTSTASSPGKQVFTCNQEPLFH